MMESDADVYMDDMVSDFSDGDVSLDDNSFAAENRAPVTKKSKATVTKKTTKKAHKNAEDAQSISVLTSTENLANLPAPIVKAAAGKKKTVEETYQKMSQLEHILIRPDTYIGSVEPHTKLMFILEDDKIIEKEITYTPGLFKIFDEIVVNAADNKQRDPNMDKLDVTINAEENVISIQNNGKGIPIVMHKEHGIYVPELILGHLLTGSNFDDGERKTTGGRNGYGAKLANVFSTEFVVECADTENGLKYRQVFRENMKQKDKPVVKALTAKEMKAADYVKITFSPDLERFKMDRLDEDTVGLLSKRAYDIAGTMSQSSGKKLLVSLNGKKLPIKSFKDFIGVFEGINKPSAFETSDRWEVGVAASDDAAMKQVSFVNSISTSKGGTHVQYIADQVASHLAKAITKKNKKGGEVKASFIKNHLAIFVNCLIENPAFDSQTKEFMTSKPKDFGSTCKLSDSFLKKLEKSAIVENVLAFSQFRDRQALKNKSGKKKAKLTGIDKLDDANFAGTAKSKDCTLIITEGDSAKSLAMAGLSVIGRDYYGVFPLRGKPLNVRDAPIKAVTSNEEIKNVVEIMGLKFQTVYDETNIKQLRYGHLMIMADQDNDGSHIKGLIINFIHNFWPSLLDIPGFLQQFITPIVKVSKGQKSQSFFNLPEYENWLESTGKNGHGWNIKYYKGLGTSTSAEAKEYFSNLDLHEVHFGMLSNDKIEAAIDDDLQQVLPDTVQSGNDLIDMVFRKNRVEDRKQWLNAIAKDTFLNYSEVSKEGVMYSEFINREYILFSKSDNERSIPHLLDGFKPSQRKILFACFKRKLKGEIKVAQLTGYVAEHSAYHHGEASLQATIVNMAQNFCGSNNINLLTPSGQFGTRRMGGKDAASARYIFTKLEPITRAIFHPDDDELLSYINDDGVTVEPEYYVPVIPMILVNGADGIGTGWSTSVNNYNPREIVRNLRRKIAGEDFVAMAPFYSGFKGEIIPVDSNSRRSGSYDMLGKVERINDTTIIISELPVRKWTQDYKAFLEIMLTGDGKKKLPEIKDFTENHTETTVSFTIIAEKEKIDEFEKEKAGLMGKFKLTGSLSTSNMTLFDERGRITRFEDPESIMNAFYDIRLDFYDKRKRLLVKKLKEEQRKLSNKARFVEEVCRVELVVNNRKRQDILHELRNRGYETFGADARSKETSDSDGEEDSINESQSDAELARGYEYLLGMKIWSLTFEKAEELRRKLGEKTTELNALQGTSPSELWLNDLDDVEAALNARDIDLEEAEVNERKAQKKNQKRRAKAAKTTTRGKKKDEWDSELESSDGNESDRIPIVHKINPRQQPIPKKKCVVGKPALSNSKSILKVSAAPAKLPSARSKDSDCDSEDDGLGRSLIERMKSKLHVSPQKVPARKRAVLKQKAKDKTNAALAFVSNGCDSLTSLNASKFVPASLTPAKPHVPKVNNEIASKGKKAKVKSFDDTESDELEFDSEKEIPSKSSTVVGLSRTGRTTKRVAYAYSDDEDESDSDF